ncbi:MAG: hypothetical protein GF401_14005 [Chitinivibrionales bacterium]|nr:hypothetical protein [Chitinivibrionales bacterium]
MDGLRGPAGIENPLSLTMDADKLVFAVFTVNGTRSNKESATRSLQYYTLSLQSSRGT